MDDVNEQRIAFLDCRQGASAALVFAALLDAGAAPGPIEAALQSLGFSAPIELLIERALREDEEACLVRVRGGGAREEHFFADAARMIKDSQLSAPVQKQSIGALRRLAEVEALRQGVSVDQVRFIEAGAADVLSDLCGACLALEQFQVTEVYASALPSPEMISNAGGALLAEIVRSFDDCPPFVELARGAGATSDPPLQGAALIVQIGRVDEV